MPHGSHRAGRPSRVLVVEDEPTALLLLRTQLERHQCEVVAASGVAAAQTAVLARGAGEFDAVISDYRLPEASGIDLLRWLQEKDYALGTVMVTAESDREVIARSLRSGAVDFLTKPYLPRELLGAVDRAVESTRRRRDLRAAELSVQEISRVQQTLLALQAEAFGPRIDVSYFPRQQAGGDFAAVFPTGPNRFMLVVTDVSGHDLKAAFIASYFQGIVRGMMACAAPIERVFAFFNRFLLVEWNRPSNWARDGLIQTSLAACAIEVDLNAGEVGVLNCSFPPPLLIDADGVAEWSTATPQVPLGWFEDTQLGVTREALPHGRLCVWSDGVSDLAAQKGIDPLAIVCHLRLARQRGAPPAYLLNLRDDVMAMTVDLRPAPGGDPREIDHVIVCQDIPGDQAGRIDEWQQGWERTLGFLVPMRDDRRFDLLLATREAVLNALEHGCEARADRQARVQMNWHPASARLQVRVADPGNGYEPALQRRHEAAAEFEHRGLALIGKLAGGIRTERNGAVLWLDFDLNLLPTV